MSLGMFCKKCGNARDTKISMRLCGPCHVIYRRNYDRKYVRPYTLVGFFDRIRKAAKRLVRIYL